MNSIFCRSEQCVLALRCASLSNVDVSYFVESNGGIRKNLQLHLAEIRDTNGSDSTSSPSSTAVENVMCGFSGNRRVGVSKEPGKPRHASVNPASASLLSLCCFLLMTMVIVAMATHITRTKIITSTSSHVSRPFLGALGYMKSGGRNRDV